MCPSTQHHFPCLFVFTNSQHLAHKFTASASLHVDPPFAKTVRKSWFPEPPNVSREQNIALTLLYTIILSDP